MLQLYLHQKIFKYIQVIFVYRLRNILYKRLYNMCVLIIQKQYINNLIEDAHTAILYLINFQNFIDRVGLTMI